MRIRVEGVERTKFNMQRTVRQIYKGVQLGTVAAAKIIQEKSKENAPVDTSNLRASHYVYFNGGAVPQSRILPAAGVDVFRLKQAHAHAMSRAITEIRDDKTVRIGAYAFYALYNELGHKSKARFMQRAVSENTNNILRLAALGGANAIK